MYSNDQEQEVRVCRDCGEQIVWLERRNRSGETKHYPFDYPLTQSPKYRDYVRHHCLEYEERRNSQYQQYKVSSNSQKARGIPCDICGAPITFSEDQRSIITGNLIPLELTLERHVHRSTKTLKQYSGGRYDGANLNKQQEQGVMPMTENKISDEQIWGSEEDVSY